MSYGTTSGVITSLGLLIGLYSTSSTKGIILAGLLTIAFADALSDGLGIHVSEETQKRPVKSIWEATISTVLAKMVLGLSFIIPLLFFPLTVAVIINLVWGLVVLSVLSFLVARQNREQISSVLREHVGLAVFVIIGSLIIGRLISSHFN